MTGATTARPGPVPPTGPGLPDRTAFRTVVLLSAAAVAIGAVGFATGPIASVAVCGVALFVLTAVRPVVATYVYFATLPFLAGIERDTLLPLIRPNEALLALLVAAAVTGGYVRFLRGVPLRLRFAPLDAALAAFVLASTLWPVASLMLRGHAPSGAEFAALLPVIKLSGILLLVRTTLDTDERQVRLVRIVLWTSAALAVIAVLQTLNVGPVITALNTLWAMPDDNGEIAERATATFASSIATGDYLVVALAMLAALGTRDLVRPRTVVVLAPLLGAGVLAAGQFSSWAALGIVAVVLLRQYPELRALTRRLLPVVAVALVVGAPALITRLAEFGSGFGVPRSWLGRWDNVTNFNLPAFDLVNVLIGISPDSVLPAPETWREVIYLEFGYLQLLWVGGLPLLAAFGWLSVEILRRTRALRGGAGGQGVAATTLHAAWWVVLILSLIDIHLVLRGMGDLLFLLLGIVMRSADVRETP